MMARAIARPSPLPPASSDSCFVEPGERLEDPLTHPPGSAHRRSRHPTAPWSVDATATVIPRRLHAVRRCRRGFESHGRRRHDQRRRSPAPSSTREGDPGGLRSPEQLDDDERGEIEPLHADRVHRLRRAGEEPQIAARSSRRATSIRQSCGDLPSRRGRDRRDPPRARCGSPTSGLRNSCDAGEANRRCCAASRSQPVEHPVQRRPKAGDLLVALPARRPDRTDRSPRSGRGHAHRIDGCESPADQPVESHAGATRARHPSEQPVPQIRLGSSAAASSEYREHRHQAVAVGTERASR